MSLRTLRLASRAALAAMAAALFVATPTHAQTVTGSGSTLVQPLLNRWNQDNLRSQWTAESQPSGGLDYEASGSMAGVMRIKDRAVDFGASEVPLSPEEAKQYGVAQFPIVVGGVAAAVNLPGVSQGALKLSGELIADIYLGKVKTWSDPAIKALNPDLALPADEIRPVRRSDGSGTTFAFTSYLAKISEGWKTVGAGQTVEWPVGRPARGNGGVAEMISRTPNSIGYLDLATARKAGLTVASLKNAAGAFVAPSAEGFQAAAANAPWNAANDFGVSLVDAPGAAAYPIVVTTFALVPDARPVATGTAAALAFFNWGFERGDSVAAELGYVPLPPETVEKIRGYWRDKLGAEPTLEPQAG
ncbi:phosphate ABC transporter substrate-binding protein PstS [Chenggangzhangella methanolivorans]|uniref:Phosphate-binding protein PstS n=1 Tax=Chenggangzhangella methanolivorans TaxID=1437009 RepID=A0A9E6R6K9_9HYPH|nr:phosphate ABC transporter substrate-binding protein PstS [Chenggangzhangella methanolivorans]QZN99200.1 phosphate ABC transporter substrate-binding protein PstS [Chenggangzhangella methanolivorans]